MELRLRRLAPGELDHEMIWLSVTASAALFTLIWLRLGLPWPRCVFHALIGLPCLTCGSTRAALAMAHGNLAEGWYHNPLAFLALGGLAVFDAYAFVVLVSRAPRLRVAFSSAGLRRASIALLLCAALVNWVYLIHHGS